MQKFNTILKRALLFVLILQAAMANAQTVLSTAGTYNYYVPATGTYTFVLTGADGGDSFGSNPAGQAGSGAKMTASFNLTAGDQLRIFVGSPGQDATSDSRSGGGGAGGTAIILNGTTVLIAAGGGAGGSRGALGGGGRANINPTPVGGLAPYGAGGGGFGFAGANSVSGTCPGFGGGAASLTTISAGGQGFNQGCFGGGNGGAGFGGGGGQTPQGGGGGGGYAGGNGTTTSFGNPGSIGGDSYVHISGTSITAVAGVDGASGFNNTPGSVTSTPAILPCTSATTPTIIASANPLCTGLSTTLSIASGSLNANLDWKWYTGSCGGTLVGTGTSITVSPTSATTYFVRGEGGCSSAGACGSITVTVSASPATPTITANGPTTICEGNSVILTSSSANGYQWELNGGIISGQTNQSLTVSAAGNYSVRATNASGCFSTSSATVVTVKQTSSSVSNQTICASELPYSWNGLTFTTGGSQIAHLTNAVGCDSAATLILTVNPLPSNPTANVIQPTCSVATGTINVTAPLGGDFVYSIGGAYQISPSFTNLVPGTYILSVQSNAGCFAASTTSVTVDPQPFVPAAASVSGFVNVCPYIGTGQQITYTASAPGATNYNWIIPSANVSIISGQGTANLTVTFANGYNLQANKQFRVTASSICGTAPQSILYTLAQAPVTPNPIAGPTSVCGFIGTETTVNYKVSPVLGANSYNWIVPVGCIVTHPNGTGVNDTVISVKYLAGFTGGSIAVTASNGCGASGIRSLLINYANPSTPGLISGSSNACASMLPGGTAATYTIAPVAGAASYNWVAPSGSIVTHPNGAGANDHTINVLYPAGFTSGTISVSATNGCGTSGLRSLTIGKLNPATPGLPDIIQTGFCGDEGGRVYSYTIASMPLNATSVNWVVPTAQGATLLSGQGTTSITVSYPSTAVDGSITLQGISNCGASLARSIAVKLPACATTFTKGNAGDNHETSKGMLLNNETGIAISVFPNPTIADFSIKVMAAANEQIKVSIMDMAGREIKRLNVNANQLTSIGSDLKAGTYILKAVYGKEIRTTKIIKL